MFQSEDQTTFLQFAEKLYDAFLKKVIKRDINNGKLTNGGAPMTCYTATVTAAYANGKITVQRQYDTTTSQFNAVPSMQSAAVGSQVLVVKFGDGDNAANSWVVAYTDFRNL